MNTTRQWGANGLTLDDLATMQKLLEDIPPAPFFASWSLLPRDHAITFTLDGRDYAGCHPEMWKKIPTADRGQCNSLFAIEIIDLDLPSNSGKLDAFQHALLKATVKP